MSKRVDHKYQVGDKVNGLLILSQIRIGKQNQRAYKVQSITYPNAPTYEALEYNLIDGKGDAYVAGRRIFEGNSLYSVEWVRPYIDDIEQSKTIAPNHTKKVNFKCPDCNRIKEMTPHKFTIHGFICHNCSKGTSYPELFFMSYLEVKGIEFEYQKLYEDLKGRRFDFYIESIGVIEIHGKQHFVDVDAWDSKETRKSDKIKRKFCEENDINLIELDCRESSFQFIKREINNCSQLPCITKEDNNKILKVMEDNKRYPVKKMIDYYKSGKTIKEVAKEYKVSPSTVTNILKRSGVKSRLNRRKVRCINTGEVFDSMLEACEWCGLKRGAICAMLKRNGKYAGFHPITGEKLNWEYVD